MISRTWWSATLIGLISTLALTACVGGTRGTQAKTPPSPDAALLVTCPDSLPPAKSGRLPDLAENHKESAQRYHLVCTQLNNLIEAATPPPKTETRWWQFWRIYW